MRKERLLTFLNFLGIDFDDISLLDTALTHSSYINEDPLISQHNEKLEFLGDSVVGLIANDFLYSTFTTDNEGELSRKKSLLVCEASLASIAKVMNVQEYILLSKGEEMSNARERPSILADTLEAVIGAYYLDKGFDHVKEFFTPYLINAMKEINELPDYHDYKTFLQIHVQKTLKKTPVYELVNEEGPEHQKTFYVQVKIEGEITGKGKGNSKKAAQQEAAKNSLISLGLVECSDK